MTYVEVIQKYVEKEFKGTNNTCNGKCTRCGECCGHILPIDEEDFNRIREYVFKHQIFAKKYMLVMCKKLFCPYYTGDKNKGCSIYEARPKICRYYKCDLKGLSVEEMKTMQKAIPINMWALAKDFEKEMKKSGLNKKTGKTANKSI